MSNSINWDESYWLSAEEVETLGLDETTSVLDLEKRA